MDDLDKTTLPGTDPARAVVSEGSLRQQYLIRITRRLVILTGAALTLLAAFVYRGLSAIPEGSAEATSGVNKTYIVLLVFTAGLIGGFVSIQQRLPRIALDELRELAGSWLSAVLIPINGGIFAVILHLMFLGGILQGSLFPEYTHPDIDPDRVLQTFRAWLTHAFPADGQSIAKLFFWSFVAGFSERLVPQIIQKTSQDAAASKG